VDENETRRERMEEAVPAASATAGPQIGRDEWVARSA
jgi:hypothetical protein